MKQLYKSSKLTIDRYTSVALDSEDKLLSGSNGWIFEAGPKCIGVVTCYKNGEERIEYVDISLIGKHIKRIGFDGNRKAAEVYANNPNQRLDDKNKT